MADRVLALFMLNTLADNARKFTPEGGRVEISATEGDGYVELSVADTGQGMTADQLAHVFDHKVQQGHGFGLMNCKGIIEKYRKTSNLFSVCSLQAESQEGRGSRFFFRLPKGVVRLLAIGYWLLAMSQPLSANSPKLTANSPLCRLSILLQHQWHLCPYAAVCRLLHHSPQCSLSSAASSGTTAAAVHQRTGYTS